MFDQVLGSESDCTVSIKLAENNFYYGFHWIGYMYAVQLSLAICIGLVQCHFSQMLKSYVVYLDIIYPCNFVVSK